MTEGQTRARGPLSAGIFLVLILVGGVGYVLTQQEVTVFADGQAIALNTHQTNVGNVLDAAGVELMPGDQVSPTVDAPLQNGLQITVDRARLGTVDVDGRLLTRRTQASTVTELLEELDIPLGPADTVLADGVQIWPPLATNVDQPGSLPSQITVNRVVAISVKDNGAETTLATFETTVGRALQAAGIVLYLGDDVQPPQHTKVTNGLKVIISRSAPVSVEVDGQVIHTRTHRGSVGELLAELGVALIGQDYALPGLSEIVEPDVTVRVVRVLEEIVTEQEPIAYETAWQLDPNLEIDQRRVAQAGAPGVLQRRIRVRFENGQEVSRVLEDEWMAQEPVNHIIAYGSMLVPRGVETPAGPQEYWRTIRVLATSYTAATSGKERDHSAYGITAVGWPMRRGIIAVDPRLINLFQDVYVPGYGVAVAADTGGAIKGRRIDLGYEEDSLQLWYSWLDIYLLMPPPEPDKIRYILPELE